MKLLLSILAFAAAFPLIASGLDYTTFEPGNYTFNGILICGTGQLRNDAVVYLIEDDPISPDDYVTEANIGPDGKFTVTTIGQVIKDPPSHDWELRLEFFNHCDTTKIPPVFAGFLKPDTDNTGYAVKYTVKKESDVWNKWSVEVEA